MRPLPLLCCCLVAVGAEDPAPVTVSLHIGDVPAMVAAFRDTWMGRALRSELLQPERRDLIAAREHLFRDTGIALPTWEKMRALRLDVGDDGAQLQATGWLDGDTVAVLAEVDAAAARWVSALPERRDIVALTSSPSSTGTATGVLASSVRFPVLRQGGTVRFAYEPWLVLSTGPQDGWAATTQSDHVVFWELPTTCAAPVHPRPAVSSTIAIQAAVGSLLTDTGIPLLHAVAEAAHLTTASLTIAASAADLSEIVHLPNARLPLQAVTLGGLAAHVPTNTCAITVVGLDGKTMAAFAQVLTSAHPQALDERTAAALAATTGTVWLAVTETSSLPAIVVGLPASDALDALIASFAPNNPALIERSRAHPVAIPAIRGLCGPLAVRRMADTWLISTNAEALNALGNSPALAAVTPLVDGRVVAAAWQDSARLAKALMPAATVAWFGLKTQGIADRSDDAMIAVRRQLMLDCSERLVRWLNLAGRDARPTTWTMTQDDDGLHLNGRNASTGFATAPLGLIWWWYAFPQLWPYEGVGSRFLSLARRSADGSPVQTRYQQDYYERLGAPGSIPQAQAQVELLATRASGPRTRTQALSDLAIILGQRRAEGFPLWLAATKDPCSAPRQRAWSLLATQLDPPGTGPDELITALLDGVRHADPRTRETAIQIAAQRSRQIHWRRQAAMSFEGLDPALQKPAPPPPALLEPLLTTVDQEADAEVRAITVEALGGYVDERIAPRLRRLLADQQPAVRSMAAQVLLSDPRQRADPAVVAACVGLLTDDAPLRWSGTVGAAVCAEILPLTDPQVTAALFARCDRLLASPAGDADMPKLLVETAKRGHLPAINEIARHLEKPRVEDFDQLYQYLYIRALGACPAPEAEVVLVRLLRSPALISTDRSLVIGSLHMRGKAQPDTIEVIIGLMGDADESVRQSARKSLQALPLTPAQRAQVAQAEKDARTRLGANAFGDRPPPDVEQPPPVNVNDF